MACHTSWAVILPASAHFLWIDVRLQLVFPATAGRDWPEHPREGNACPLEVPVLNVTSSLAPAGLHSDLESTSTVQEDWGGGGLP